MMNILLPTILYDVKVTRRFGCHLLKQLYLLRKMNLKSYTHYVLVIFLFQIYNVKCEVISSLILCGTVISSYFGWNFIKCKYSECCDDKYINFDMKKLEESFKQKLFGQPLVTEITNILKAHKKGLGDHTKKNKKALVLSLHGWSGVGKNFAISLVAEAIFKNGMQSNFVKVFMGKKDFDCSDLEKSQRELLAKIKELVKECPISLIVFDEIHEMCPSILDSLKPMLDHHHAVDGVDYRNAIFVFISNIGGQEIASKLLELYSQGVIRNDVEFHNFEPILRRTAYNTGGFKKSMTIAQHLIDHYIPFLPLEQHHVQMCASAEFRIHGIHNPTEEMMSDALSVITYGPTEEQPIFANNGCKRFTKQIPYIIQKYKHKNEL